MGMDHRGAILENLDKVIELLNKAETGIMDYSELSRGGRSDLSEEERQNRLIKSYIEAKISVETARENILSVKEMVSAEFK